MLGKLLKYELKAMGRIILPLYLVLILAAGLFAVNIKLNDKTQTLTGFMNILSIKNVPSNFKAKTTSKFYS